MKPCFSFPAKTNFPIAFQISLIAIVILSAGQMALPAEAGTLAAATAATPAIHTSTTIACRVTYPFGAFDLPQANWGAPYSGAIMQMQPATTIVTLNLARSHGMRILVILAGGRTNYQNPDGSFSLLLWERQIDHFNGIDLSAYIADGTIVAAGLFDEPQDTWGNWGGHAVLNSDIDSAAGYLQSKHPGIKALIGSHFDYLLARGYAWKHLNGAIDPFTWRNSPNHDPAAYAQAEIARAQAHSFVIITNLNGVNGGVNGGEMTAAQFLAWGSAIINLRGSTGMFLWKWSASPDLNGAYWNRADINPIVKQLGRLAAARTGC